MFSLNKFIIIQPQISFFLLQSNRNIYHFSQGQASVATSWLLGQYVSYLAIRLLAWFLKSVLMTGGFISPNISVTSWDASIPVCPGLPDLCCSLSPTKERKKLAQSASATAPITESFLMLCCLEMAALLAPALLPALSSPAFWSSLQCRTMVTYCSFSSKSTIHPNSHTTVQVSLVRCQIYHMSLKKYVCIKKMDKVMKLVCGGYIINRATPSSFIICNIQLDLLVLVLVLLLLLLLLVLLVLMLLRGFAVYF